MARSASSVDNAAVLYHSWFPCRAEIFLTPGLVVMGEISMAARRLIYYLQHGTFSNDIILHTYSGGENHIKYIKD